MAYDIVLIMVPPWEPKRPPLGLAYIVEYLKSKGFSVKVIDFNLRLYKYAEEKDRIFWEIANINFMPLPEITNSMFSIFNRQIENLVDEILSCDARFIGFSVNVASSGLGGRIASQIKKKNKKKIIVFGGTGCFWENDRRLIFAEDISAIDAFVIGEGEEVLERVLHRNPLTADGLDNIGGIVYKKEDFLKPAKPYYTKDLDTLPFPKFSDFDIPSYQDKSIPIVISRGCVCKCSFCIDHLMCGGYRFRSPDKIIDEIKYHISKNEITNFAFNDLACNGNLQQLAKICDGIIRSGLTISWESYAIIRKDMDFELLKKMKKAGCASLCYGMESGSDAMLKRMNKFYNSADAELVIRLTHEAGIMAAINIIVGFPGETRDNFNETIDFIKRNKAYISEVTNVSNFVVMFPSKVGQYPSDYGITSNVNPDPYRYIDINGVDISERTNRLKKTIFVISAYAIRNVIVNQPGVERKIDKQRVALLSLPPARTDMPSLAIARAYSYLRSNNFSPIVFDMNIKLYNAVGQAFKGFWAAENYYLWSSPNKIFNISDAVLEETFHLTEEPFALKTNIFYFLITKENLMFSILIASILKKWAPHTYIIFDSPIFKDIMKFEVIPEGVIDIFVVSRSLETLGAILESGNSYSERIPNTITYKDGTFERNVDDVSGICGEETQDNFAIDFTGFDLSQYDNLQLPI